MALDLLKLEKQKISKDIKGKFMLFYGLPGIGKTSLASKFPKVLILGFEQGTNGIDDEYVVPCPKWSDFKAYVSQLVRKPECKEKYQTIAIDTADSAWDQCARVICEKEGISDLDELEFGKGFAKAGKEFKATLEELTFAGYTVIFISHATEREIKNKETGEKYMYVQPALASRPYNVVNKMVDLTGYIREVETAEGSDRYIFFRGTKNFFAKSRFEYIVPHVKFSYENIVNAILDAVQKAAEAKRGKGADVSDAANPYTQKSFDDLMSEAKEVWIKISDNGKVNEALKILEDEFGKPTKFSEILPEQIEQLKIVLAGVKELVDDYSGED